MPTTNKDTLADPFLAIADLREHLATARQALKLSFDDADSSADREGPPLLRILDVAQAAVASLEDYAGGLRRCFQEGASISLEREGPKVTVTVIGTPTSADIAAFIDELIRIDQRLLTVAALLGLLLRLCVGWVAAAFAPFLVLKTLAESGPRILELGASLISDEGAEASAGPDIDRPRNS